MLTTSLLIGLAAALAGLAIAAVSLPAADPRPAKTGAPPRRSMDASLWVRGWPHEAPKTPFTEAQAHQVMQSHRACHRDECPRKDAAWMVLVDAGQIRPRMPLIGGFR